MDFKYDVAFSFLKEDEELASKLNELLKERLKTFLYSEKQKELAGTNGEDSFNKAFGKDSRVVVVLYREGWGETPWTRMEETAIRNRAFDEGYDFTIFIPLEKPSQVPKWLPKPRLYVGLDRWGLEGCASVIEAKVLETGGAVREVTLIERFANAKEKLEREKNRKAILSGSQGRSLSISEYQAILGQFNAKAREIISGLPDWHLRVRENKVSGIDLISYGCTLAIQFYDVEFQTYMSVKLIDGVFNDDGYADSFHKPKIVENWALHFSLNENDEHGWCDAKTGKNFKLPSTIVETMMKKFLGLVEKKRREDNY